jgi:hypothetical protein
MKWSFINAAKVLFIGFAALCKIRHPTARCWVARRWSVSERNRGALSRAIALVLTIRHQCFFIPLANLLLSFLRPSDRLHPSVGFHQAQAFSPALVFPPSSAVDPHSRAAAFGHGPSHSSH